MRENAFNCWLVANAWRHCWRGHATAPPPASSKCLQRLPGNRRWGDETRIAIRSLLGSPRLGSAILGTARRKHRFIYYCAIAGACFDVTILTWRKYATVLSPLLLLFVPMKKYSLSAHSDYKSQNAFQIKHDISVPKAKYFRVLYGYKS
jgi:hypothetical protein